MLEVRGIVSIYARAGDSHIPHCPSPSGRDRKNRFPWNVKHARSSTEGGLYPYVRSESSKVTMVIASGESPLGDGIQTIGFDTTH